MLLTFITFVTAISLNSLYASVQEIIRILCCSKDACSPISEKQKTNCITMEIKTTVFRATMITVTAVLPTTLFSGKLQNQGWMRI